MPPIALLTDFGTQDTYVGVMKGVIAAIAQRARVIDITHHVPPGDVRRAAFQLWQAARFFPAGSVFVVVVDPGVGSLRRAVAVAWDSITAVAPDNGVLTYLLAGRPAKAAVVLEDPAYQLEPVSSTFHGRDIFAPAGAHIAAGVQLEALGPNVDPGELVRIDTPRLERREDGSLVGQVLHPDRFGNLITSLGRLWAEEAILRLEPWLPTVTPGTFEPSHTVAALPGGRSLPLQRTFSDVAPGQAVAYIGSDGLLEIAVRNGDAARELDLYGGETVRLESKDGT